MKDLLKLALVLALAFASTFVIMRMTGLLDEADVRAFLAGAHEINPLYFVALVMLLLWIDILIAIPTMATILLAGYFLGPALGAAASVGGLMLMGLSGYGLGRGYGRAVLTRLYRDEARLAAIEASFARSDLLVLFVCQALPILPELSCCLAGVARMRFTRFLMGYTVGVVPFAVIVAYAGSVSTVADPWPAIWTVIGVSTFLLLIWTLVKRRTNAHADPIN